MTEIRIDSPGRGPQLPAFLETCPSASGLCRHPCSERGSHTACVRKASLPQPPPRWGPEGLGSPHGPGPHPERMHTGSNTLFQVGEATALIRALDKRPICSCCEPGAALNVRDAIPSTRAVALPLRAPSLVRAHDKPEGSARAAWNAPTWTWNA